MRGNEAAYQKDKALGNRKSLVSAGSDSLREDKAQLPFGSILGSFVSLPVWCGRNLTDWVVGKSSDVVSFLSKC